MKDFEKQISSLIANQFPSLYAEEGPFLIEFLKAYYEWLEQPGNPVYESRTLLNYRDVDETVDEFLIHFKKKFLADIQFETTTNKRLFIKNALDFYRSKGTERSVELLFKLVYGEDPEVYFPSQDIFRLSDNEWVKPTYLEVSSSPYNLLFINEQITGVTSGATAFVESYVRKRVGSKYIDVLFISVPTGDFETGEIIRLSSGRVVADLPVVVGSTSSIDIIGGSLGFSVGDIVSFESNTGLQGKARVSEVSDITGVVDFNLEDSGFGYFIDSDVVISSKNLGIQNASNTNFVLFETVTQPKANVFMDDVTGTFSINDVVNFYYSDDTPAGVGKVMEISQDQLYVSLVSGTIKSDLLTVNTAISTNTISVKTATANALVTAIIDKTVTANVIGYNTNTIGVTQITSSYPFVSLDGNYIEFSNSGIVANVSSVSTGSGASFKIANLTNRETLWYFPDRLSDKNTDNVFFYDVDLANNAFGLPKNPAANISTILYDALDIKIGDIGGIAGITAENPGSDYNVDPFVVVIEPTIYGFDKRDYIIDLTVTSGPGFIVGERVTQVSSLANSVILEVENSGQPQYGELVYQSNGTANVATGIVRSFSIAANTGTVSLDFVDGAFVVDYPITFWSGDTADVTAIDESQVQTTAYGIVKEVVDSTTIKVKRISFNDSFNTDGGSIIGSSTATHATINFVSPDEQDPAIGINGVVSANVQAGAGAIKSLQVIDSGFGYRQDEVISAVSEDGSRVVSIKLNLNRQGVGEGYYNSSKSFVSADKYIQDGEYYQEYSYEVLSRLPFSKYADVLKKALHVAGTKAFGSVVMSSVNPVDIVSTSEIIKEID